MGVPSEYMPMGLGLMENSFPLRALLPGSKNSPTLGKCLGMHPSISRTDLETSTMLPSMTYTMALASTDSSVTKCSPLILAKNTPRLPAMVELAQFRLISDLSKLSTSKPRPGRWSRPRRKHCAPVSAVDVFRTMSFCWLFTRLSFHSRFTVHFRGGLCFL